ncbi:response regulator [candidate division KSB1 bacterium]|nr:response regulator [candidate division KSB1 bacterium]RQW00924.1 MAG: response regulator [candidate division KSB1 bacterium]
MSTPKAKILVVDDELGMREGMRRILEMQNLQVDTADNGTQGVEMGVAYEYDLYFIDLKMPDLDGTEVLRSIKLAYPDAICIVATAFASIDSAVTTTQLGAYRYIPKPFDPDELVHIVKIALERRELILQTRRLQEERQKRMIEISREQSRLRTIISALDDGILVINQQGEIVLFNKAFLSLLELKQTIAVGEPFQTVLPQDMSKQIEALLSGNEQFKSIQQEIIIHPPAEKVVMANFTPIIGNDGTRIGLVSVIRDITALKKIDVLRSQFVNMAAHELKAPLSAVQGYLELIVDKALGQSTDLYDHYLTRSLDRTKALVSLINDLLNISRMEAGTLRREITSLDIQNLIEQTLSSFDNELKQHDLTIKTEFENNLHVLADQHEMQRLFNHLIGNAIKYNVQNGSIAISTNRDGHYVKIAIQDTGIGMTPEEKARLFEDFFRAKNEYTRTITGTGLGLTIVKKIVDAYSGMIEVESEFEKGSTFAVFLPASE